MNLVGGLAARIGILWIGSALLLLSAAVQAEGIYRPFIVADTSGTTLDEAVAAVKTKLQGGGLQILGQYSPYPDGSAVIIGTTSPTLLKAAAKDQYGGFGAVVRVAVTNDDGSIEVTYVNPMYMGFAYHIGDLSAVAAEYSKALGNQGSFGAKGLSPKELESYHYMMLMPYFEDTKAIASFDSHADAVRRLEAALADPASDMSAVWKVDVDADHTAFGVQLHRGKWAGGRIQKIMQSLDTGTPKSTASLPWELLVSGKSVVYLPGKYRIAIMFPDLTMGTFMKIAEVPDDMAASAESLAELMRKK